MNMKVRNSYFSLVFLFVLSLLSAPSSFGQIWAITNVAGDGTSGTYVDESEPLSTPIPKPIAMTYDANGNIYFTSVGFFDGAISGVYKINIEDNQITHILDNVPGIAGITIDRATNILYFSRGLNGAGELEPQEYIYLMDLTTGIIDTIAGDGINGEPPLGGSGETALGHHIGSAASLRIDPSGQYLYYAARYLSGTVLPTINYIQRINLATNETERVVGVGGGDETTTVADGGDALSADIAMGFGMDWDSNGNFYFATLDHMIKKVVDGKIYNVAGTGTAGKTGDGGLADEATINMSFSGFYINEDNELILCDSENNVMRKIILSGDATEDGIITKVCGTEYEEGDESNPDGDLGNGSYRQAINTNIKPYDILFVNNAHYFSDDNYRIRKIITCEGAEVAGNNMSKTDICTGDEVTLTIDGELNDAIQWSWYMDECAADAVIEGENSTSLTVTADQDRSYFVKGTGGCAAIFSDCFQFDVFLTCNEYYNTFTPNADGVNDFLEIPALDNYPINTVRIFNRWGDQLELIENYDNDTQVWYGTNGESDPVDPGTYYFTAEANDEVIVSGWIQLIK